MGIHFSSFDKFSDKLESITEQGPEIVDHFLDQEAEVIKGRVQDNTPVRKDCPAIHQGRYNGKTENQISQL